jgi:ABC-2 type transport system permease protein
MTYTLWHPLCVLVRKELKARYARPYLGFFWALLVPLVTAGTLFVVFSFFLHVRIEGIPFFVYLVTAVFPWTFFQDTVTASSASIIDNRSFLKETRVPWILVPCACSLAALISALPAFAVMVAVAAVAIGSLPPHIGLLPCIIAVHALFAAGIGALSALWFVRWRDARYAITLGLQFLFYLTPVFYSYDSVRHALPAWAQRAYGLNPCVGIIDWYRTALIWGYPTVARGFLDPLQLCMPLVSAVFVGGFAWHLYARMNRGLNDHLAF